jgi:hypothetical protein
VEIQNHLREAIEANRASSGTSIKDVYNAEAVLQELIGLMNSESGIICRTDLYNLDRGKLMKLLL